MDTIIPYDNIRDRLSWLDMLVCDHKRLFWRYVGHTAGVYVNGAGQVMVLESTQRSYSGICGVQLHPMGEWLRHYPGQVAVRQLRYRGRPYRFESPVLALRMRSRQEAFIRSVRGTSYPDLKKRSGRWKLIAARLDFELFGKDILTAGDGDAGIFCTQLKAMELITCGVLDADCNPAEYEPRDTRQRNDLNGLVGDLKDPWSYGPEIRIK